MSDSEEENFCFYGKALDPYDEDLFPKKRPIAVEEQIATDSHGRRRFHGAFTGGFSAGFFNTVGSLEGWTPSEFKSSRGSKQKHQEQNPEDFMDDEDMGEFGFAPKEIRATKDYDTSKKRKRKVFSDGPIPGEPVLHTLLTTGNETVGYLLLKNIGIEEKIKTRDEETSSTSNSRVYGCEIPKLPEIPQEIKNNDFELPEFYKEFLSTPKQDTFGLGYAGLDRSNVNIFKQSDLVVLEKDKKLSIRGQAFGVGAFENEDDDIYTKEDMSTYDFELTKEKEKSTNKKTNPRDVVFEVFVKSQINTFKREIYPPPVIPKSFTGKHKVKRSRFEPLSTPNSEKVEHKNMNPTNRAELIGEVTNNSFTASRTVLSSTKPETINKSVKTEDTNSNNSLSSSNALVRDRNKFDPSDLWNDRFVTSVQEDDAGNILAPVKKYESEHYSKEMKDAAKLKMFGPLTRISEDWQPCSLLCKRFNVPEPMSDKRNVMKNRSRTKNLIFEYQKHHEENLLLKPGLSVQNSTNTSANPQNIPDENQEKTDPVIEVKQEIDDIGSENNLINDISQDKEETKKEPTVQVEEETIETIIDITDRLNIEEKSDLFKAVFLSSSESEGEEDLVEENNISKKNEDEDHTAREIEMKSNILGEQLVLPQIKPLKEGILSGLDFKAFHKFRSPSVVEKEKEVDNLEEKSTSVSCVSIDTDIYGPKLPEKRGANEICNTSLSNLSKYSNSSSDEWIEKGNIEKSKKKKHKKDKSHKKKHKHKKSKKGF